MKIAPKLTDSFLAFPEREVRAALIFGADGGLVRERAGKIVKAVLGAMASDSFAKIEFSEAEILADPPKLNDELSAFSMMSPKRVITIQGAGSKLTKIIESSISLFNKDTYLIITAGELDSKSTLRALFEKNEKCAAIACYKDEMRAVQAVIRDKLNESGISFTHEVVDCLASQLGNDRYITYQELDKIILYAGEEKRLELAAAEALVGYNQETKLDDLINSVADKNLVSLEKQLTQNIRDGVSPILYLRSLQRYFNRLYDIRAKMTSGQSAEMVISGLRPPVFFKQAPILTRHANNWSMENIVKALKLLISAELSCKTSDIPVIPASHRKLMQITQLR